MKQTLSKHGIGASEIAAICGLNPYASPWSIWVRKVDGIEDDPNELMEWGNRLEPAIRQKYVDDTKALVLVPTKSLFHDEHPWARATPDGIALERNIECEIDKFKPEFLRDKWTHLLQCKNVGEWPGRGWNGQPPEYVQLQEQWELYVTGLQRADVAALIGGNDFRIYTVHRNDQVIADMVTIATEFWDRVTTKTPPKVDDSDACRDHFKRKLTKADDVELFADGQLELLMNEWHDLHQSQKQGERRIKTIRNTLLSALADAKADRICSPVGTAKIRRKAPKTETTTDYKLIAEVLGSTKATREEWQILLDANTKTEIVGKADATLYAPREWSQESE